MAVKYLLTRLTEYYPSSFLDTSCYILSTPSIYRAAQAKLSEKNTCGNVKAKLLCPRLMKNIVRYHIIQNLQTPIQNRISLADRIARKNSVRVGRDYASFRLSLNIVKKED